MTINLGQLEDEITFNFLTLMVMESSSEDVDPFQGPISSVFIYVFIHILGYLIHQPWSPTRGHDAADIQQTYVPGFHWLIYSAIKNK